MFGVAYRSAALCCRSNALKAKIDLTTWTLRAAFVFWPNLFYGPLMKFTFPYIKPVDASEADWSNWQWQLQRSLRTEEDFSQRLLLRDEERTAFQKGKNLFQVRTTPYYLSLLESDDDPLRRILVPTEKELEMGAQAELDPLNERKNNPVARVIHRYPDRVLLLATDMCSVYCRYCTRKHFTGQDHSVMTQDELSNALNYIRSRPGIREVILSGGDPLTLGDGFLDRLLTQIRAIEHIEIIRLGSRMPVVCPMRVTPSLAQMLRKHKPVVVMTHFNHPKELTAQAAFALETFVDNGIPVFNQMVLLNGVNNHPAIVQALSRRLLYLRVKPYYAFQCDPSEGTDHLRTSVEETMAIQRALWGNLSGLAMPTFSLDIPSGGGKLTLVPNFEESRSDGVRKYKGWDGVSAEYRDPDPRGRVLPSDYENYLSEWDSIRNSKL